MSLWVWHGHPGVHERFSFLAPAYTRYPPFVSNSRHVTRQKILNWKQQLRFPSRPRVSHEGVDFMQRLLCEPEDRLGSQSSVSTSRPNSLIVSVRRSGFFGQMGGGSTSVDGAEHIKVKSSLPCAMEAESGRKLTGSSRSACFTTTPTATTTTTGVPAVVLLDNVLWMCAAVDSLLLRLSPAVAVTTTGIQRLTHSPLPTAGACLVQRDRLG